MPAKKQPVSENVSLSTDDGPRPRLHKLIIKNFRAIGAHPIEIELDDIVVLVGPNNVGKSSILRAYEIVMSHGSKQGKLAIEDFPRGQVDSENLPEIELHTIVFDQAPGANWISKVSENEFLIKERWIWSSPNKDPVRQGFDVQKSDWDPKVPWGAPNIANTRRPRPHRIDAFASPEEQTKKITGIVIDLLKENMKEIRTDPGQDLSDYDLVLERISALQSKVVDATGDQIRVIEKEISEYLSRIFPSHRVKFDAKPETDIEKAYTPFKTNADILMGKDGGYFSTIERQGSGARRTLLWATLRYVSEHENKGDGRPHVLLLDEPEICLHPSAIREARSVLYNLPSANNWQVMVTTHSPVFIDLARDNTTVIRVHLEGDSEVSSTTLYRPTRAKLSDDDKKNLKLLNLCDPYMYEFFFGGRQIVVEGDTEYTALSILKDAYPDEYSDVQIIRARGKGIIPSLARILLQFSKGFSILHDADSEKTVAGKANPAWGMNKSIREILDWDGAKGRVQLVACKTCFEEAIYETNISYEKPYHAMLKMNSDQAVRDHVKELLDSLLDHTLAPPINCVRWSSIEELH